MEALYSQNIPKSASPKGKYDPLLTPRNRIVKLDKSGPELTLSLEKSHLEDIVASVIERNPSYADLPVVFFSVLGKNIEQLRTLHTDWLIHYYHHQNSYQPSFSDDDHEIYKQWQPKFGPCVQLKYFGGCKADGEGLYIWPTPFLVTEMGTGSQEGSVKEVLVFILYSSVGINNCHKGSVLLDRLAACVTTKIIVFKEEEKIQLRSLIKEVHGDTLPPLTKFIEVTGRLALVASKQSRETLTSGWDSFLESLRDSGKILGDRRSMKNLPTLKTLMDHMKLIAAEIRDVPEFSGKIKVEVLPKEVAMAPSETRKESYGRSKSREYPQENGTNNEDFRVEFQRWLVQDLMMPFDKTQIVDRLDLNEPEVLKWLRSLQAVINGYNFQLQNMFDNYVCFEGDDHEGQMIRFQQMARQREKQNWMSWCPKSFETSPSFPVVEQLHTEICQWLCKRYLDDNDGIIKNETEVVREVFDELVSAYVTQMKSVMKRRKLGETELLQAHLRMCSHCTGALNRCMDYSGRLNNVVSRSTNQLFTALNKQFEILKANMHFSDDDDW